MTFTYPRVKMGKDNNHVRTARAVYCDHCDVVIVTSRFVAPKTLNEKTGNSALILYKTNGQRAVLSAYYAPFPLST